jgi:hypothetical protein
MVFILGGASPRRMDLMQRNIHVCDAARQATCSIPAMQQTHGSLRIYLFLQALQTALLKGGGKPVFEPGDAIEK